MFFGFPAIVACLNLTAGEPFQSYTVSGHQELSVACAAGNRCFVFIGDSAKNVEIFDLTATLPLAKPYAFATQVSLGLRFDAGSSTDVVFVITSQYACANGAYYTAGGGGVTLTMKSNASERVQSTYCVFSPSADGQPVTVRYGMTEYRQGYEYATIYYKDGASFGSKVCESKEMCNISLPDAFYFVSYYKSEAWVGDFNYARTNMDGDDKFTGCAASPILYIPQPAVRVPWDVDKAENLCLTRSETTLIVIIICAVLGGVLLLVVVALCCCGCCVSCGIAGCIRRANQLPPTSAYEPMTSNQPSGGYYTQGQSVQYPPAQPQYGYPQGNQGGYYA